MPLFVELSGSELSDVDGECKMRMRAAMDIEVLIIAFACLGRSRAQAVSAASVCNGTSTKDKTSKES
jgi:hypothetical protein